MVVLKTYNSLQLLRPVHTSLKSFASRYSLSPSGHWAVHNIYIYLRVDCLFTDNKDSLRVSTLFPLQQQHPTPTNTLSFIPLSIPFITVLQHQQCHCITLVLS